MSLNLCASGQCLDVLPLDFHVSLITYTVQQYSDSVSGACLPLKNSCEPLERTRLNQYLSAGFEVSSDFYKTCRINLGGNDFNHIVINRRRVTTYTHNAMYSYGETDLMKQTVQLEPGEEVPGKQRLNEIRRFARELIEAAIPYLGKKCFQIPSL